MFIPFSSPDIGIDEIEEVVDTLKSGWLTTGKKAERFESEFSNFVSNENIFSVSVNSATAGLHLALEALGISENDEVITTSYTFTATAEIIRYLGADPIFVDIEKDSLCINPEEIERKITKKTKAIIVVHFGGLAANMDQIISIAKKHNLYIVEDSAHALPCSYNGRLIGSLNTDVSVFSFYANKTITTGEGGMLVTRNKEIAERVKIMRLHGIDKSIFDRYISNKPSWAYEVVAPGYKYNMTDIAASIGIHQLKKTFIFQKSRDNIAKKYLEELKDLPIILPKPPTNDLHAWHLFVIQILENKKGISRDKFIDEMFKRGIGCSVHYIPLHLHSYWKKKYKLNSEQFPISQKVFEKCVSLPIYSKLKKSQVDKVINTIREILL